MEEGAPVSRGEVLKKLDEIQKTVDKNPEQVAGYIFNAMNEFSKMVMGEKKESESEDVIAGKEYFLGQRGGFGLPSLPSLPSLRAPLTPSLGPELVTIKDSDTSYISLDKAYYGIKKLLNQIDIKNREIASIVGPVAFLKGMKKDPSVGPYGIYLPIRVGVPKNSIIPVITYFIEALRMLTLSGPLDIPILRKILSIAVATLDIMNGQWKNGILSLLGLAGKYPMIIGIIGRVLRLIWSFVSPDIRNDLEENIFFAGKSIFAGFWLNMISTFAPESMRKIIDSVLVKLKDIAISVNQNLDTVEQAARVSGDKLGLVVKFPRIPIDELPSADDLRNLVVILRRKEVVCNPSTRSIITPMMQQPALRLLLELLNIPSSDEAFAEKCAGVSPDLSTAIGSALEPQIMPIQQQPQQQQPAQEQQQQQQPAQEPQQQPQPQQQPPQPQQQPPQPQQQPPQPQQQPPQPQEGTQVGGNQNRPTTTLLYRRQLNHGQNTKTA